MVSICFKVDHGHTLQTDRLIDQMRLVINNEIIDFEIFIHTETRELIAKVMTSQLLPQSPSLCVCDIVCQLSVEVSIYLSLGNIQINMTYCPN